MILDDNSLDPHQNFSDNINLYRHQLKAIRALHDIEKDHRIDTVVYRNSINVVRTNFAIYADKVGAGKTIVIVALISGCDVPTPKYNIPVFASSNYTMTVTNPVDENVTYRMETTLIIVPHNLTHQWSETIVKFGNVTYKLIKSKKDIELFSIQHYPSIILLSSTQADKFLSKVHNDCDKILCWDRLVIDEPQTMNCLIRCLDHMDARFTWFVCATPKDLFYYYSGRPTYLNSSRYFPRTGPQFDDMQGSLTVKNDDRFIEQSIALPPYNKHYILCKAPAYYNIVRQHMPSQAALERLRANDISGAIDTFDCESGSEDNIVEKLTKFYIDKIDRLNYANLIIQNDPYITNERKAERIQKNNEKIQEFNVKVDAMKQRITSTEEMICPICLDEVKSPRAITKCCQNSFCMNCILETLNTGYNSCPLCKELLTNRDLIIENIAQDNSNEVHEETKSTDDKMPVLKYKNNALKSFIEEISPEQKVIVFSEYDRTFETFKEDIVDSNIRCTVLKGRVETQTRIINEFNAGDIQVIMLNTNYCGAGLNLQMATDIVVYHKLSSTVEKQVIGRAQRPGRLTPLNVTYLHYEDEY